MTCLVSVSSTFPTLNGVDQPTQALLYRSSKFPVYARRDALCLANVAIAWLETCRISPAWKARLHSAVPQQHVPSLISQRCCVPRQSTHRFPEGISPAMEARPRSAVPQHHAPSASAKRFHAQSDNNSQALSMYGCTDPCNPSRTSPMLGLSLAQRGRTWQCALIFAPPLQRL